MKKQFILAAIAAIALTSCQQEKNTEGNINPAGKNSVSFVLQGGGATRSGEATAPVRQGVNLSLGQIAEGVELFLEETIADLDVAETRGTPVYTENLGYLYRDKMGVHTSTYTGDVTYKQISEDNLADGKYWCYGYEYPTNIWPDETTPVDFAFRMPVDMTGVSLSYTGAATTFTYTSPTTATGTKDIIFGGISINHKDYYDAYAKFGGAKVTLYHALTGVKFAIANTEEEVANIQIDKITFTGLVNTGTCTFTPTDSKITWTNTNAAEGNTISQTFEPSDLVTYDKDTDGNHFADSYFDGGIKQNINDAAASKTFWLMPQTLSAASTAKLKIEYTINGTSDSMEINVKDLHAQTWNPGELRTLTFKLTEVNLKIEDKVSLAGTAATGFEGSSKTDVTITNTGNTRAFIRASLVGQWLRDIYAIDPDTGDETDELIESYPVFGFTDNVNNLYEVASWYQDQFVTLAGASQPARKQGKFTGLSGYDKNNGNNDWVLCKDGYYYYTVALEPESQDVNGNSKTKALFTKYEVGIAPMSTIAGLAIKNKNMHFTLEIATQAIAANKRDGTVDTWLNAWQKASVTPVPEQ